MFELTNYSDLFYISAQIFEKNMVWFIQFWKPKQARRLFDPLFFLHGTLDSIHISILVFHHTIAIERRCIDSRVGSRTLFSWCVVDLWTGGARRARVHHAWRLAGWNGDGTKCRVVKSEFPQFWVVFGRFLILPSLNLQLWYDSVFLFFHVMSCMLWTKKSVSTIVPYIYWCPFFVYYNMYRYMQILYDIVNLSTFFHWFTCVALRSHRILLGDPPERWQTLANSPVFRWRLICTTSLHDFNAWTLWDRDVSLEMWRFGALSSLGHGIREKMEPDLMIWRWV